MLQTIIVSLSTSLIVSLITFVLGMKSGKNQTDRLKLQDMYKQIYSHFYNLKEGLADGRPKEWTDYKKVETMHTIKYYPPIRELKQTGDILYIKKKIADMALSLEKDCLSYAYQCNCLIAKLHESIFTHPDFYKGEYSYETYQKRDDTSHFKTSNTNKCITYRYESYFTFFDDKKLREILQNWDKSEQPYAITFSTRGNPPKYSFTLFPCDLKVDTSIYICQLLEIFKRDIPAYSGMIEEKEKLEGQIEKLCKKLISRAKEPSGFWETFFGAFADIFH
jgi:hypothetical protein|nr:hypothetical protein [uncultured Lachnoclostridium sp.]